MTLILRYMPESQKRGHRDRRNICLQNRQARAANQSPSEAFDWDAAIQRLKAMLEGMGYGK